ncbi:MAG TPA: OmpA family protein, partial [Kofleriaceae bacterium]
VAATPPVAKQTSNSLQTEVYFGLGSSSIGNRAALDKAASWLKANADVTAEIGGHADPTGSPEGNMTLSQARADGVRDYLVGAGVDASRLHVHAFGDTQLKYGRDDQRNRRVIVEAKK